jgi:hypothetical protein
LTAARLDFAGARFAGAAFRLDAVGLAERPAFGFAFFAGAFFAAGAGFFADCDGPLAVAARTSVPPGAGAAAGAPVEAPSPSQNLISARSSPPGLR